MGVLSERLNAYSRTNIGNAPDVPMYSEQQFIRPRIREDVYGRVPIIQDVRPLRAEEAMAYKSVLQEPSYDYPQDINEGYADETLTQKRRMSWEEFQERQNRLQEGGFEQEQQYQQRPRYDNQFKQVPPKPFSYTASTTPRFKVAGGRKIITTDGFGQRLPIQKVQPAPQPVQGGPRKSVKENSAVADSLYNMFGG